MNDNFLQQLLTLIKIAHDGIESAIQRQSAELYKILLAQAAVLGLFLLLNEGKMINHWIACSLVAAEIALVIFGCLFVAMAQTALTQRRGILEEGYYPFLDDRLKNIVVGPLGKAPFGRWAHHWVYMAILIFSGLFMISVILILAVPKL